MVKPTCAEPTPAETINDLPPPTYYYNLVPPRPPLQRVAPPTGKTDTDRTVKEAVISTQPDTVRQWAFLLLVMLHRAHCRASDTTVTAPHHTSQAVQTVRASYSTGCTAYFHDPLGTRGVLVRGLPA